MKINKEYSKKKDNTISNFKTCFSLIQKVFVMSFFTGVVNKFFHIISAPQVSATKMLNL